MNRMGDPSKAALITALVVLLPVLHGASIPVPFECGVDNEPKLLSDVSGLDEYPWTALLQYRKSNKTSGFHCQGSLINTRYVVTAAHCVSGLPDGMELSNVRLGEYDLSKEQDCVNHGRHLECTDPPVDVEIESIIVHEDFNARRHLNDIALVRLNRDVEYSHFINPVCLPIDDDTRLRNITDERMTEAGWFRTEPARLSDQKMKQYKRIVDRTTCADKYKPTKIDIAEESHVCAKTEREDRVVCGYGGVPLMKRIDRSIFLYGITSFGPQGCRVNSIPDVYTNVARYVDWIKSKVE